MAKFDIYNIVGDHTILFGLHLPNYRLKIDHAIAMLRELDSLNELQFQMRSSKCSQLSSQLDGDCEATYNRISTHAHQ